MIKIEDLSKAFEKQEVLRGVNFTIYPGEITALVGRNGTGKTTLLECMNGILKPDTGEVYLEDKALSSAPEVLENMMFVPDSFDYFKYDRIKNMAEYYGIVYPNFDRAYFDQEVASQGFDPNKSISKLSKGMKKILGVITAFSTGAEYLFFDEVLDGIDVINKAKVFSYMIDGAEEGKSILISSHDLASLEGISHKVLYLTEEGNVKDMNVTSQNKLLKYQLVSAQELPLAIRNRGVVKQELGRVSQMIFEGEREELELFFNEEGIVQFDLLPLKIEDMFFWENGRKGGHYESN